MHNALVGIGARDRIKLGAAGKIITAFDIARAMALGADWCNAARGFMFAVGCIQSQSCHTDRCPTGVATQDPTRQRALVVPDKIERVANFHRATLHELAELTAAAGFDHPNEFKPIHISRRISPSEVVDLRRPLSGAGRGRAGGRHRQSALAPALGHGPGAFVPRRGLEAANSVAYRPVLAQQLAQPRNQEKPRETP